MEGFVSFVVIGVFIALIVYFVSKGKKEEAINKEISLNEKNIEEERKRAELEEQRAKWEARKSEYEKNGLPVVEIGTLKLTKNEVCHFVGSAKFCKIKQQTVGYEGGSRGVSLRVMKGISFRVGNHQGHYIKEKITEKTGGQIYLTNKKIIFTAEANSCVVRYKDIVNLNVVENMLQIQTEKKSYLFEIIDAYNFMLILECATNKNDEENSSLCDN